MHIYISTFGESKLLALRLSGTVSLCDTYQGRVDLMYSLHCSHSLYYNFKLRDFSDPVKVRSLLHTHRRSHSHGQYSRI
jgi:hypothetical protein